MITGQPPRTQAAGMRPHHRARLTETAGITALGLWLLAVSRAPLLPSAAALAVGGTATGIAVLAVTASGHLAAAISGWGIFAPAWLTAVRVAHAAWTATGFASLAAGSAVLVAWAWAAWHHHLRGEAEHAIDAARAERRAEAGRWTALLAGLGAPGITCRGETEGRTGKVVTLVMPASGKITIRHLLPLAEQAAAALRAEPGAVWFEQGSNAAEVLMHIDEADALAEDAPFPPGDQQLETVNQPFGVGINADGTICETLFREVAVLIIGSTGSGKSNLSSVLIAQLTRMPDVVVFGIDFAGGRLFAPWIRPWIDGRCERPAVDWVATDREEAAIMLDALLAVGEARDASLIGGSKITPSPDMPQIVLIADEVADIFGDTSPKGQPGPSNRDMTEKGARLTRKARKAAVMPVWETQRGTVTMVGSGDLKSQCRLRFALGAASEADARSAVADDTAAARLLARLRHPGTGVVWQPGAVRAAPVRFWRLDPAVPEDLARIDSMARKAGRTRPAPDLMAQQAMGDAYTRRWERSDLYQRIGADSPAAEELARLPHPGKPVPPPARIPADPARDSEVFRAMMESEGLTGAKPDPRGRMYALLAGRPIMGLSVYEIGTVLDREGIGVARETIHRWLREDIDKGVVTRSGQPGSPGARYLLTGAA